MPHLSSKLAPGRTEVQKRHPAVQIVRDVLDIAGTDEALVSVAIEEVPPAAWMAQVYQADILPHWAHLHQEPGYQPLRSTNLLT